MTDGKPPSAEARPPDRPRLKRILAIVGIALLALLALVLLLGLLPLSSRGLESQPDPAAAYQEALDRFGDVEQSERGQVNDLGHSRLLAHGEKTPHAYVLVHGTTNSPEQ